MLHRLHVEDMMPVTDTTTTHYDLITLVFLIPLFCILYSMMSIWIYDYHENREGRRREKAWR